MNRLFVVCVQTYVLAKRPPLSASDATRVVIEAAALPDDAVPKNLLKGVQDFAESLLGNCDKPEWLREHEEKKAVKEVAIRLTDNEAQAWWFEAEKLAAEAPVKTRHVIARMVTGRERNVVVPEEYAGAFRHWVESLPSYEEHDAPFAFKVVE